MRPSKIRVLIVDDSAVVQTLFSKLLALDPEIEVVGVAQDPFKARDMLLDLRPDVMTLDIEMPRMDGLTFLDKVMEYFPTRTLIVSSLSAKGSEVAYRALESGAIDVLEKPVLKSKDDALEFGKVLIAKIKGIAQAQIIKPSGSELQNRTFAPEPVVFTQSSNRLIAIASSTGGPTALKRVLPRLPANIPGTVIVQHMPPTFSKMLANSLQTLCPFEVKEAVEGDEVVPGRVLVAPGNFHMEVRRRNAGPYTIHLHQDPTLNGVRPSADYLFRSVAKFAGSHAVGVILTGMGRDGSAGLLAMKEAGSFNIAQDEKTCVIYGMPKEASKVGAIDSIVSLKDIPDAIVRACQKKRRAA